MSRVLLAPLLALLSGGLSACVTGGDKRADLIPIFRDQIRPCYVAPLTARGGEATVLELRLNADGSLAQLPKVVHWGSKPSGAQAALTAVERCTPFHIPTHIAHRYTDWKVMRVAFELN